MFKFLRNAYLGNNHLLFLITNVVILGLMIYFTIIYPLDWTTTLIFYLLGFGIALLWFFILGKKNEENKIYSFRKRVLQCLIFVVLMTPLAGMEVERNAKFNEDYEFSGSFDKGYPKACKGTCGETIKRKKDDYNGYHVVCKPGKNGESTLDRASRP